MSSSHFANIFQINIKNITALSGQTVVHRKKFEFAVSQLQQLGEKIKDMPIQTDKISSFTSRMGKYFQELAGIFNQNVLQTWTVNTIENKCNSVMNSLTELFTKIKEAVKEELNGLGLEDYIKPDSEQWIQYNNLDLRAILASFTQYLNSNIKDKRLQEKIQVRIDSINKSMENSTNDGLQRNFSPIPLNYLTYKVNLSDFQYISEIGHGVSAKVFLAVDKRESTPPERKNVAIKQLSFETFNSAHFQAFQRELAVLATANHPALVSFVGATDTPPFCIVTEWMPNGSLFHDLHVHHRLDPTMKTIAAYDIARGMQYLHSKNITHRDLKSLNVLLDSSLHAHVCDFGFSRKADDDHKMTSNIGTIHWMAPELLIIGKPYTSKVDVYAYGILLWELATNQTPYSGMDLHDIIEKVSNYDLRPALPSNINPFYANLMTQCWDRDPDVRPTFDEIIKQFKTNKILINDANPEEVQKYIKECVTSAEQVLCEMEKMMQKLKCNEITIEDAYNKFDIPKIY